MICANRPSNETIEEEPTGRMQVGYIKMSVIYTINALLNPPLQIGSCSTVARQVKPNVKPNLRVASTYESAKIRSIESLASHASERSEASQRLLDALAYTLASVTAYALDG